MKENKAIWNGYSIYGDTKEIDYIVESNGHINLDFDDIIATLSPEGNNFVASGKAATLDGAFDSAAGKLPTPIKNAKRVLIQFIFGNKVIDMADLGSITETFIEASNETFLHWGVVSDPSLGKDFKVIILLSE